MEPRTGCNPFLTPSTCLRSTMSTDQQSSTRPPNSTCHVTCQEFCLVVPSLSPTPRRRRRPCHDVDRLQHIALGQFHDDEFTQVPSQCRFPVVLPPHDHVARHSLERDGGKDRRWSCSRIRWFVHVRMWDDESDRKSAVRRDPNCDVSEDRPCRGCSPLECRIGAGTPAPTDRFPT